MGLRRQTLLALLFVAAAAAGGQAARRGEAQAVSSTLCCSNTTAYHECVKACFEYYPREQADKICDPGCKEAYQCRVVSGDKCPTGQHSPAASSDDILTTDSFAAVVPEPRAVTTTLCCSNMTGFHECVHDCLAYFPQEQAEKICNPGCQEAYQCRTVSGDKCPSGHLVNNSAEGNNAVEKCVSGCRSSVCSKMATGVGSKHVAAVTHALGRCNNACYNLCTKGTATA